MCLPQVVDLTKEACTLLNGCNYNIMELNSRSTGLPRYAKISSRSVAKCSQLCYSAPPTCCLSSADMSGEGEGGVGGGGWFSLFLPVHNIWLSLPLN